MLHKKSTFKILAHKPDIFGAIPKEVLDDRSAGHLRDIPRLAMAEIAGPADADALCDLLRHCKPDGLLPTISYTGSEYGDWERLGETAAQLKKNIQNRLRIFVADPVVLGSPALWKALRDIHTDELARSIGHACPCLGCRLYSFMLRVPLGKKVGARFFIPSLGGMLQRGCPADLKSFEKKYFSLMMSGYGIEVWYQERLNGDGDDTGPFLSCVLGGADWAGVPHAALTRYFETFALPLAGRILSRAVFGAEVDYARIITETTAKKSVAKK